MASQQAAIFAGGGDYPGNEFIIGSGRDALLCRYKSGRRKLSKRDQLNLEFAGVYRHYHAAFMRTLIIGKPTAHHLEMEKAAREALCLRWKASCVRATPPATSSTPMPGSWTSTACRSTA